MKLAVVFTALVSLAALAACDPDEQDRVLYHEPGTYQGKVDTPLSQEQVRELRGRATLQGRQ